jgi:copper chaperone CopZ
MNCGHCEGKVKSALATVPGVDRFSVDLSAKKVQVTLSKNQPADFSQINDALTKAGYPGEQV